MQTILLMGIPFSALRFVDLYIAQDYADFKGLDGATTPRTPVETPEHTAAVAELRQICEEKFAQEQDSEFSVIYEDVLFRVTQITDVVGKSVFILRRAAPEVRSLSEIGLHPKVVEQVLNAKTRGLFLVVGEMAAGKTSTIASLFRERIRHYGGIGLAIEDPIETRLNGVHGNGRIIQVRATRRTGGYREQLVRAVRSGTDAILIGEIREEETAFQAAQAGINGHMIFSTMHAGSIPQALERLAAWVRLKSANGNDILAQGLTGIVHQKLMRVPRQDASAGVTTRMVSSVLMMDDMGIRSKIRTGAFMQLENDIEAQAKRMVWAPTPSASRGPEQARR